LVKHIKKKIMAYKQPYKSAILRVDPPDDPTSSFRQGVDRDQTRKEVRAEQKNKKKESRAHSKNTKPQSKVSKFIAKNTKSNPGGSNTKGKVNKLKGKGQESKEIAKASKGRGAGNVCTQAKMLAGGCGN